MSLVAGNGVAISGPLAAERQVLFDAGLRQVELALADCGGFDREELADHSIALTASVERASVVSARFAAVAQEQACALTKGQPSMTAVLNSEARISRKRGSLLDLVGSAKDRYGLFYRALLDGGITVGHIEVLHPVWRAVDGVQFAMAQQRLVELAAMCTPEEFAQYLAEWRHHADEDASLDEYIANQAKQHCQYGFDVFGNVHYSGTVGPEFAEPFVETIETEAANHRSEDSRPSQAFGDALVDLVLNPDGKYRAHLEVLSPEHHTKSDIEQSDSAVTDGPVTAGQVIARDHAAKRRANRIGDPHDLGFSSVYYPRTARGTLIPPAVVERMKANGARVRTHTVDADGNIAGDRHHGRHFGEIQKRLIRLRDNRCRHPGCRRPAHRCEYDHIETSEHGGPTLIRNGQTLCQFHHRWKHRHDPGPNRPTIFDNTPLLVPLE